MTTRPPVQIWQLVGTSLLCGVAVAVSSVFPTGSPNGLFSLATWAFGLLLISVGSISLIEGGTGFARMIVPTVLLCYFVGTALLLPRNLTLLASAISIGQLLLFCGLAIKWQIQNQAAPSCVEIKVVSEAPTSKSDPPPDAQAAELNDGLDNKNIDTDREQAILSRLSLNQTVEEELSETEESIDDTPSIQFQSAEHQIRQRYERGLDPEGREWLEGTFRVDFLRNQRTAVIHIPFWPAFHFQPRVNSELLDGPHLKIDVKTVERWGIRLELTRRAAGLDPDSAELAFFVTTESKAQGAA